MERKGQVIGVVTILMMCICHGSTAQEPLRRISEIVPHGSYGKALGDNLLYLGMADDFTPYIKIKSYKPSLSEKLINRTWSSYPVGWISNDIILLFEKKADRGVIYQLDVNTRKILKEVKVDSVFQPELYVASNKQVVIYANHYLKDPYFRTYKYDFQSQKRQQIVQLTGRRIQRIAYNYEKDIIAFVESEGEYSFVSVLAGGLVRRIVKLNGENESSERPIALSDDAELLFYISQKDDKVILYKHDFNSNKSIELSEFEKGIKCIDLSWSFGKLFLTIKGKESSSGVKTAEDLRYSYKIGFEFPFSIYSISDERSESVK